MITIKQTGKEHGFTIVELLVVIIIISILAAITIVSYTGITQRAIVTTLQSDLTSAATQMKIYQVLNSSYPTSNDCSSGPNPAPPKICLKTSSGNSYVDFIIDNSATQTFCITGENGVIDYKVTNDINPVAGKCTNAATSPSGLIANGGTKQVVLNWIAPASDGGSPITGYKVYQGTSAGGETLLATIGNVLTYTSTSLSAGTTYFYRVTAINGLGESGSSNENSGTTAALIDLTFNPTSTGQNGTIQSWVVSVTGNYSVNVLGASGGIASGYRGGYGARVTATLSLTAGTNLRILVGQKGLDSGYATGGGASGIWVNGAATPLVIAGGGGGANAVTNAHIGGDASLTTSGIASYGTAGTGGNGAGPGYVGTGGGAGWYTDGQGEYSPYAIALKNGATGGTGQTAGTYDGSFGGGGAGFGGGGGGGGYSGGGAGNYTVAASYGGGGGSFSAGTGSVFTLGNNTGSGLVTITEQ